MSISDGSNVMLNDRTKWDDWEKAFLCMAITLDLSEVVKGYERTVPEPELPRPAEFHLVGSTENTAGGGINGIDSTSSSTTTAIFRPASVSVAQLSTADVTRFNVALTKYKLEYELYKEQNKRIQKLREWMLSSINVNYAIHAFQNTSDLATAYKNLKQHAGRTDFEMKKDILTEYNRITKPMTRAPRDIDSWIVSWEQIMQKGIQYDMSFTRDGIEWSERFFCAIQQLNPDWVQEYKWMIEKRAIQGSLTYQELSNAFRNEVNELKRRASGMFGNGGIVSTFPTEHDQRDEEDRRGQDHQHHQYPQKSHQHQHQNQNQQHQQHHQQQQHRPAPAPAKKRKIGHEENTGCKACGGSTHGLRNCGYVFNGVAPRNWRPIKAIQDKVDQAMATDSKLAGEVDRLLAFKNDGIKRENN